MAEVRSLGVHRPVALSYLVSEGLLPKDPRRDSYQWETSVHNTQYGDVLEEVLATKDCVVWSEGEFIRNVYRFEQEGEKVVQALLANFPRRKPITALGRADHGARTRTNGDAQFASPSKPKYGGSRRDTLRHESAGADVNRPSGRALVVLLKTKVHIHSINGTRHIVNLPFEVDKAFPSPRGLLLQRKITTSPPTQSLRPLIAPPNSFLSTIPASSSYLDSPTIAKSFGGSQRQKPAFPSTQTKLGGLLHDISTASLEDPEEENAGLYTLTSPLSEIGVVTSSIQHLKPRLSNRNPGGLSVDFESLDPAEKVVYVSQSNELGKRGQDGGELILIVTTNAELQTLTLWHAWYIEEKTLCSLLRHKAAQKAAKARRRSSFLSANIGTGATTPAARPRDGNRESLAAGGAKRILSESQSQHTTRASSRRPTKKDEEEAMASQLDPDYAPGESKRQTRESRRISSLVSRGELSTADPRASQTSTGGSFTGLGGRRNTSFGGAIGRSSLGRRKSRASTPGSTFSRTLAIEDDSMDLDSEFDAEGEESLEAVLRHVRATYDAAGAESILMDSSEAYKKEMVVRKVHSLDLPDRHMEHRRCKVATLKSQCALSVEHELPMSLYVHNGATVPLFRLDLVVKQRPLWPKDPLSPLASIPVLLNETALDPCDDIATINHDSLNALLLGREALLFSPYPHASCPPPRLAPYRFHDASRNTLLYHYDNKDIGKNRLLDPPHSAITFHHVGSDGTFDEVGPDGTHHRRQIKLKPLDKRVEDLLQVSEYALIEHRSEILRKTWCMACDWLLQRPDALTGTEAGVEVVALLAAIFVNFVASLDQKARSNLRISRMAAGKRRASGGPSRYGSSTQDTAGARSEAAWNWMDELLSHVNSATAPSSSHAAEDKQKDQLLAIAAGLADELLPSIAQQSPWLIDVNAHGHRVTCARKLLLSLHLFREEQKLDIVSDDFAFLVPVIAQIGVWLGAEAWGYGDSTYYDLEQPEDGRWAWVKGTLKAGPWPGLFMATPIGIYEWFESCIKGSPRSYPTLSDVAWNGEDLMPEGWFRTQARDITPRTAVLGSIMTETKAFRGSAVYTVELMAKLKVTLSMLETFPTAFALPFREAIAKCEREPPTDWSNDLLGLVGRDDLVRNETSTYTTTIPGPSSGQSTRDVQTICHAFDAPVLATKTREAGRHAISQLIFSEDRRLVEATSIMHYNSVQTAECAKQPDWTDTFHFEQQRRVMQWVTTRTIALPAGDAMIHYDSQTPLLTEKFHLSGFSSSCVMQPMGHTVTTDRTGLSEEKINWAFFHAGVSAGLRISRNSEGIDTSWIVFNKPDDLKNRHAGLLLALGLSGHLRHLAKWLSFKYLTPKHTMTSVGLLLGLAASYMGTMDSLITRMLSVHITKMLPFGAAELNVSPATQTAGLMGIGLLYYNSQHRRMSEVMLSEIEYMELGDPDDGPDLLRDESYRLAAGFALGLINLGKGKDLRGLHGMQLPERLLAMAIGPRPVNAVHVFEQATASAVMAVALVYMKSGNKAVAQKIDIPDTETQYDHVRPDILLLRTAARHMVLWDDIEAQGSNQGVPVWIQSELPRCYKSRIQDLKQPAYRTISSDIPFYNIATGLAWSLSLKYAGTGSIPARQEILALLDVFHAQLHRGEAFYYDAKLARSTLRRCIDVLCLSAATVMSGTGDIPTFRYLRRQHARTNAETSYGSHLAAHLAIGVLFLGGGTYTLCTSDLATASLMLAFYPLFPTDVQDNRCHLQALRHFWVFAAEARCIVIQDIDTHRPIPMPILVKLKTGETRHMRAPCLLPELDSIAHIETADRGYWTVTLDFALNPQHLAAFRRDQTVSVRRCPVSEAHDTVFGAAFAALAQAHATGRERGVEARVWEEVLRLPVVRQLGLSAAELELVLPPETQSGVLLSPWGTVVDERLGLTGAVGEAFTRDELWSLRCLFALAERVKEVGGEEGGERMEERWIGWEFLRGLERMVEERSRRWAEEET